MGPDGIKTIAGLGLGGGKKDNFFLCLLEFYPESERWFVKSVLHVNDMIGKDGNEAIKDLTTNYNLRDLVVDFPLTNPPCHGCERDCPGLEVCPVEEIEIVQHMIKEFLDHDKKLYEQGPKAYEYQRNEEDKVDYSFDILTKPPHEHLLSKSFKRRLKKQFLPYWNRPLDLWVWMNYHDHLLQLFNETYDSFGNTSLMLMSRFAYLKRHFPEVLSFYEGNTRICLIELLRAKIITKSQIFDLKDIQLGPIARLNIIKKIEEKLNVFLYDHDLEILVKEPRAFQSFLLAIIGQRIMTESTYEVPKWCDDQKANFAVPSFS